MESLGVGRDSLWVLRLRLVCVAPFLDIPQLLVGLFAFPIPSVG